MENIFLKIPKGWSVKKLGDIGVFSKGAGITKNDLVLEGLPCIRYAELYTKYNFIIPDCVSFISEEVSKNAKPVHRGDILFAGSGETKEEIGKCAVYDNQVTAYAGGDNIIFRPEKDNSTFLSYFLNTAGRRYLNRLGQGDSIVHIHADNLKKVFILLPPLAEQEKIAEILGTWDEAIEKLSNLIEQKKLLKKGLMQKLLTGKVRLPGSTRPWKEVKLGEIFNIKKGQGLSKEVLDDNGLNKCILYGELYTKYSEVIKDIESRTNQSGGILSQIGDILIPASTTTTGIDLANATALLKENVLLGGDINILRAKKEVSSIFFAYLLTHAYKFDIAKLAQGITIVHLYGEFLKNMKVYIPSDISEQQAIANVLSTADDEIYLLNKKLMMFKEQKKGLMQQLLTGTIRVKVN